MELPCSSTCWYLSNPCSDCAYTTEGDADDSDEVVNVYYNAVDLRDRFNILQRYSIPVNDLKDKSVTMTILSVQPGTLCDVFYHSFRRWLKAMGVPIVQYLYEANFHEVLCGNLPEAKSPRSEQDSLPNKDSSAQSAGAVSDQGQEVEPA